MSAFELVGVMFCSLFLAVCCAAFIIWMADSGRLGSSLLADSFGFVLWILSFAALVALLGLTIGACLALAVKLSGAA